MAVHLYQSSDADAPKLSGETGKLIEVLEACLVTGYGSKAGAGWTVEKDPTAEKGFFKPSDPGATGCGLYLEDIGTGGGGARFAQGVGVEPAAWDGFDGAGDPQIVGNRFPAVAQVSWGSWWYKAVNANADARAWKLLADDRFFYFIPDPRGLWTDGNSSTAGGCAHAFGDLLPFGVVDTYSCIISGNTTDNDSTFLAGSQLQSGGEGFALFNPSDLRQRSYAARSPTGQLPAVAGRGNVLGQTWPATGGTTYPLPGTLDDALLHPLYWTENGAPRGILPGAYSLYHTRPFSHGAQTLLGDGRTVLHVEIPQDRWDNTGCLVSFDITGPWR